jgi:CheY-like chemotaxis protein
MQQPTATVLVYSDNADTRAQVRLAAGRRPASDAPAVEYVECATLPAVLSTLEESYVDVCVLDGEAVPAGGMGVCRQIKDEIFRCPPVLLLIGRPQDAWLATWSRADAAVSHPVDPVALADALAGLLRDRDGHGARSAGAA